MRFAALLFDFDGVLIESEYAGNAQIARWLTANGFPTTPEQSMANFMGLAGREFLDAVSAWMGRPIPAEFHAARAEEDARAVRDGLSEVAGAVAFVRTLPADLPRAVVSSSRTPWLEAHLRHLGIRDAFGPHLYSGREHVARGKPAPDLYLYAAGQLGVPIGRCAILEDSPVGATGAVASGGHVIGFCGGSHCAPGHDTKLRAIGVRDIAHSFEEVARLIA